MIRDFEFVAPNEGDLHSAYMVHFACSEEWGVETLSEAYDLAVHHVGHCPALHPHEEGA